MSRRTVGKNKVRVQTFNRGQNSADEASTLINGFAQKIENGLITDVGKVEQRKGQAKLGYEAAEPNDEKINGLTRFNTSTTLDSIFRVTDKGMEYLDSDTLGWTYVSGCVTTSGAITSDFVISGSVVAGDLLSSGSAPIASGVATDFTQALDLMFLLDGDSVFAMDKNKKVMKFADTNTDPPKGLSGEFLQNNRVFIGGSNTESERDYVWFSDSLDPATWDRSVNVFKVGQGEGGKITKIKKFRERELVIYKTNSVYLLNASGATPVSDWTLSIVNSKYGCEAPRSVVSLGDEHIFLSQDGVRLFTRTSNDYIRNAIISKPIDDIIKRINKDVISKASAIYANNKYILGIPVDSATENNFVIIWDSQAARIAGDMSQGWTVIPKNTWYPSCWTSYEFGDNETTIVMGDNRDITTVYKAFNTNLDVATAISMKVRGPRHEITSGIEGVWGPLQIKADGTQATELIVDGSTDGGTMRRIGKVPVDVGGGVDLPVDLPVDLTAGVDKAVSYLQPKKLGRSEFMELEFTHNDSNKPFTLNEYSLWVQQFGG